MSDSQAFQRRRDLGARIRALREAQGWSQEALAHRVGIDRTYVGSVERGERNVGVDNIWRIADALGVTAKDLFV